MAAKYTYYTANLRTGLDPQAELLFDQVRASRVLNDAGTFTGTLALGSPQTLKKGVADTLTPDRTALYVVRDDLIVWGGIVEKTLYDSQQKALQVTARETWWYFQQRGDGRGRFIENTLVFAQKDQLAIAQDLLAYAQGLQLNAANGAPFTIAKPGGNVNVTLGSETSGVLRDMTYYNYEGKGISDAVKALAELDNGFDFSIDPVWTSGPGSQILTPLHLWYPRAGRPAGTTALSWTYPGNIFSYTYPVGGLATTVYASGPGDGDAMLRSSSSIQSLIDAGYPLIERQISYKDQGVTQAILNAHAVSDAKAFGQPAILPVAYVRADDPPLGSYVCGDEGPFHITDERFPNPGLDGLDHSLNANLRILSYEIQPTGGQNGAEQVALTLGPSLT